jgi:predicted RNase H-like HicB family nuclease
MSYLVVIERGDTSVGAYVPDLPGCAAVADTEEDALRLVREAIALHIEGLKEQGLPVPEPRSRAEL